MRGDEILRRRVLRSRKRRSGKGSGRVYLGVRVRDIGKKGLSHPQEAINITKEIVNDYTNGRINRVKFNRRTAILALAVMRDSDFTKKQKARILALINFIRVVFKLKPLVFSRSMRDDEFKRMYYRAYEEYYRTFEKNFRSNLKHEAEKYLKGLYEGKA